MVQEPLRANLKQAVHAAGLLQAAGVSTSLNNTGQQWDAPNAWAPLQWFMIQAMQQNGRTAPLFGLRRLHLTEAGLGAALQLNSRPGA